MINKIGTSIVPRGMPEITGDQSEQLPVNMAMLPSICQKISNPQ